MRYFMISSLNSKSFSVILMRILWISYRGTTVRIPRWIGSFSVCYLLGSDGGGVGESVSLDNLDVSRGVEGLLGSESLLLVLLLHVVDSDVEIVNGLLGIGAVDLLVKL